MIATLVLGCSTATPSVPPTSTAGPSSDPSSSSTQAPAPPAEPAGLTSTDLIIAAVAEGRLDFATSLLYRAQALFGDPALPAEYATAPGPEEDLGVFLLPQAMGDELPDEILAQLEPYLVTPIDPRSAFYAGDTVAPVAAVGMAAMAGMATVADPACGESGWASQSSTMLSIKVWAKCTGTFGPDIAAALKLAEDNWPAMTDLMGQPILDAGNPDTERGQVLGGDSSIDLYLTDETICPDPKKYAKEATDCRTISNPNFFGLANFYDPGPPPGEPAAGYAVVRRSLLRDKPDEFRRTIIHEFFHVLEFAHNTAALQQPTAEKDENGDPVWDMFWFAEASAKWSEWYFEGQAGRKASADFVHQRFIKGFQARDLALDALEPAPHRYNAYVWPLFMSQELGPQVIDQAWEAIRPKTDWRGTLDAINGRLSFREHFRDFALQNLNLNVNPAGEDPRPKAWQDAFPTFPDGRPTGAQWNERGTVVTGGPTLAITESLSHLSAHYYQVGFDQDALRITINATGLDPSDAVDLDALVQIGDPADNDWRYRQLELETEWCRDRPDEDVRNMYLIVSDHDMFANVSGLIEIEASREPCVAADVTITFDATSHLHEAHWTVSGNLQPYVEGMQLGADQPIDDLVGTGTYTGRAVDGLTMSLTYIDPPRCERDQLWVPGNGDVYLTGTVIEEGWPGIDGPALLVTVFPVGEDFTLAWGLGAAGPLAGGYVEGEKYLRAAVAECGEEWSETTTITIAPGVVSP